jgi:uncharacterized protein YidB (DUF937 family)
MELKGIAANLLSGLMPGIETSYPALAPILQTIQNQPGGIAGLADKFAKGGLGEVAQSWIGSGQNIPISASQIQSVLGDSVVQDVAKKMGISPTAASGQLAELLPGIVDHLTPNGVAPEPGELLTLAERLLSKFATAKSAGAEGE